MFRSPAQQRPTSPYRTFPGKPHAQLESAESGKAYRDSQGRKVRLTAAQKAEVDAAWATFCEARNGFNPYIEGRCTRSRYLAHEAAAREIVAFQERMGLWLIHPVNAGPGLRHDDPRIVEDLPLAA